MQKNVYSSIIIIRICEVHFVFQSRTIQIYITDNKLVLNPFYLRLQQLSFRQLYQFWRHFCLIAHARNHSRHLAHISRFLPGHFLVLLLRCFLIFLLNLNKKELLKQKMERLMLHLIHLWSR